jgi:hypothetical protein
MPGDEDGNCQGFRKARAPEGLKNMQPACRLHINCSSGHDPQNISSLIDMIWVWKGCLYAGVGHNIIGVKKSGRLLQVLESPLLFC